jgi:transcription termination factor Rho
MPVDLQKLHESSLAELQAMAREQGVEFDDGMRRAELLFAIARRQIEKDGLILGRGVLEVHAEGFGFLRSPTTNFLPGNDDIYVSQTQIRRFQLETGDTVFGIVRPPKEGERYLALLRVESINGDPAGQKAPSFDALTAIHPDERVPVDGDSVLAGIDAIAPLGLGHRGLILAAPRTPRLDLLRRLTDALSHDEDLEITVLVCSAAPEDIRDWRAGTPAEVIATPFDEPAQRHLQVADIVFERARRMVERGDDVVVVVDGLERLLRAAMAEIPPTGREVGGVDASALHRLRRYFGSGRALEEGGSLTVIASLCLDDARADRTLYEELHPMANWEVHLSRAVADRGIRPAIDVQRTCCGRPDKLLDADGLSRLEDLRHGFVGDLVEDAARLQATIAAATSDGSNRAAALPFSGNAR